MLSLVPVGPPKSKRVSTLVSDSLFFFPDFPSSFSFAFSAAIIHQLAYSPFVRRGSPMSAKH